MLSAGDFLDSGVGSEADRECRDVCEDESDTENGGSPPGARKTSSSDPPLMNGECVVSFYFMSCHIKIFRIKYYLHLIVIKFL
jgi:hypothetical protein